MSAACPFADQSKRYDSRYPGSFVPGPRRGVLHSTETTGLPSYGGGSDAPHFTYDPARLHLWQHFLITRPSRALKHIGSVQTNNLGAIQIEIVAYSDAAMAKRVGGLRVDQLTPTQLAPLAKTMRWIEANAGVKPTSGLLFKPYPSSAGFVNGIRLSASRWATFNGWCGHSHVPQNDHGDPSDVAINALLAQTIPGGDTVPGQPGILIRDVTSRAVYFADGRLRHWVGSKQELIDLRYSMQHHFGCTDLSIYDIPTDRDLNTFGSLVRRGDEPAAVK